MSTLTLPKPIQRLAQADEQFMQAQADAAAGITDQATTEQTADPSPAQPEPTPQSQVPQAPVPAQDDVWKQKFDTLEGKYRSEVPTLNAQLRQSQEINQRLQADLQALQAKVEAISNKPATPEPPASTHKDAEVFGADMIEMVSRVAGESFSKHSQTFMTKVSEFTDRLDALERRLTGVSQSTQMTAQQSFMAQLENNVPDVRALDTDQQFLAWLAEVDPVYGAPRQAALDSAINALDVSRTVAIFNTYKASRAPAAQPTQAAKELERQVAPSTSAASGSPAANAPKYWSMADIDKFYTDVRRGVYRGKDEAAFRIEAEINAAISEGRIR